MPFSTSATPLKLTCTFQISLLDVFWFSYSEHHQLACYFPLLFATQKSMTHKSSGSSTCLCAEACVAPSFLVLLDFGFCCLDAIF